MSPKDNEELSQVLDALVARLYPCINSAMLDALRQHGSETAVQVGPDNTNIRQCIVDSIKHLAPKESTSTDLPFDTSGDVVPGKLTDEILGEREVWAQAYRGGIIAGKSPENCGLCADLAVKAFRERYK